MKNITKKDKHNNPVMLASEKVWNNNVLNKAEIGKIQYLVKYVDSKGKRVDKVFASKTAALNFYSTIN